MPATNGFQFPGEEALFKAMFEFLEKYNFTIDENSDQEQTVAIDPEMLGRVFENLLEDNKEKGAFYTPREIVHYMCRQSLAEYLTTSLETKHGIKDPQLREKMEKFVVNDDASEVRDWVQPLALALREVKVCDPAIGSGAFPMGM
jgi:type II restriction/modification system DNA methylase subunit YeeA